MDYIRIANTFLKGTIPYITSKSSYQRLVLLNAITKGNAIFYKDFINSTDTLLAYNASIDLYKNNAVFFCKDDATLFRFLMPIRLAMGLSSSFIISHTLYKRNNDSIFKSITDCGGTINILSNNDDVIVNLNGELNSNNITLDGNFSSQLISGFLLALPIKYSQSIINIKDNTVSQGYIDLTISLLEKAGIIVKKNSNRLILSRNYTEQNINIKPENDWSNNAFFLAGGAINGDIKATILDISNSYQPDKKIIEIFNMMEADVDIIDGQFHIRKSQLRGIDVDLSGCPDIMPIIALLCSQADGISKIYGTDRLRYKESDRLLAIIKLLEKFNCKCEYFNNFITIKPSVPCKISPDCIVDSYNDHRIAMTAVMAGLNGGGLIIKNPFCVQKSYNNFYKDFISLGGKYDVINMEA